MVPRMYQLMCHGVFLMALIPELIRAEEDAVVERKTARLFVCAHAAVDITTIHVGTELGNFIAHEADNGA